MSSLGKVSRDSLMSRGLEKLSSIFVSGPFCLLTFSGLGSLPMLYLRMTLLARSLDVLSWEGQQVFVFQNVSLRSCDSPAYELVSCI